MTNWPTESPPAFARREDEEAMASRMVLAGNRKMALCARSPRAYKTVKELATRLVVMYTAVMRRASRDKMG